MTISRLCEECTWYRTKTCAGKTDVKPGKLPCRKYKFDPLLIASETIEPTDRPPSLKDRKPDKAKPLIPMALLVGNPLKASKFRDLATKRLTKALDDMRKLGNLARRGNYEWDSEQIESIIGRLHGAVENLSKKFEK